MQFINLSYKPNAQYDATEIVNQENINQDTQNNIVGIVRSCHGLRICFHA